MWRLVNNGTLSSGWNGQVDFFLGRQERRAKIDRHFKLLLRKRTEIVTLYFAGPQRQ
jgi:hypothetical protein